MNLVSLEIDLKHKVAEGKCQGDAVIQCRGVRNIETQNMSEDFACEIGCMAMCGFVLVQKFHRSVVIFCQDCKEHKSYWPWSQTKLGIIIFNSKNFYRLF